MCGFHAGWPFYPTIANRYERPMHPTIPRDSGQRSWTPGRAQHDRRGKMKNRPVGVYSEPSDSSFSLPRGAAVPPSSFISLTSTSHTGSLFLSLYAPRCCLTASAGFGRQFAKLRVLSRLRRRYDSRKYRFPRSFCPFQPFPQRGSADQAIAGVLGGAIRLGMMYRMGRLTAIVCQFRLPLR